MATGTETEARRDRGHSHPRGGAAALFVALAVLLFGGGGAGSALADWLAPGSWLAAVVGFFALPLAFATGLQMWIGTAIFTVVVRLLLGRGFPRAGGAHLAEPLPGSFVFLPLSSGAGLVAGVVVGLVPASSSFLLSVVVFWLAGTFHGWAAWQLARRGVLVPPDSM